MTEPITARWTDERRAEIEVEEGGVVRLVPADPANTDYRRLMEGDPVTGAPPVMIDEPGSLT